MSGGSLFVVSLRNDSGDEWRRVEQDVEASRTEVDVASGQHIGWRTLDRVVHSQERSVSEMLRSGPPIIRISTGRSDLVGSSTVILLPPMGVIWQWRKKKDHPSEYIQSATGGQNG